MADHQHPMMAMFSDPQYWFRKRDAAMEHARVNMRVLMNKNCGWKYERNDPRLIEANKFWVARARRCHSIGMGWEPVIRDFVYADEHGMAKGTLYV
jgi:hypothetical protein